MERVSWFVYLRLHAGEKQGHLVSYKAKLLKPQLWLGKRVVGYYYVHVLCSVFASSEGQVGAGQDADHTDHTDSFRIPSESIVCLLRWFVSGLDDVTSFQDVDA